MLSILNIGEDEMLGKAPKKDIIKVLIVENHKIIRLSLKSSLKDFSHINVIGDVGNADEAINFIARNDIDVVLIDLIYFGVRGLEMIFKIKETAPNTKVIILSDSPNSQEVISSIGVGANAYCLSDISPESLSNVIEHVSKGVFWVDPHAASAVLRAFATKYNDVPKHKIGKLTLREQEVLNYLVAGKSNSEIAEYLCVSVHTVKAHVCSILHKFHVDDRLQAAVLAVKYNLVDFT